MNADINILAFDISNKELLRNHMSGKRQDLFRKFVNQLELISVKMHALMLVLLSARQKQLWPKFL